MANRLRLVTICYLAVIILSVYGLGSYFAVLKIQRQIIGRPPPPTPAPTWILYLAAILTLHLTLTFGLKWIRRSQRNGINRCRECGRWIGVERRCPGCGTRRSDLARPIGFDVLPTRPDDGRNKRIADGITTVLP